MLGMVSTLVLRSSTGNPAESNASPELETLWSSVATTSSPASALLWHSASRRRRYSCVPALI
jgi:hypothetical protein